MSNRRRVQTKLSLDNWQPVWRVSFQLRLFTQLLHLLHTSFVSGSLCAGAETSAPGGRQASLQDAIKPHKKQKTKRLKQEPV